MTTLFFTIIGFIFFGIEPILLLTVLFFVWLLGGKKKSKPYTTRNYERRIYRDSQKYGFNRPIRQQLKNQLLTVYRKYDQAIEDYPQLTAEYSDVISEMWKSMTHEGHPENHLLIVSHVINQWPRQNVSHESRMQKKLRHLQDLTKKWDEAKNEAMGGEHV